MCNTSGRWERRRRKGSLHEAPGMFNHDWAQEKKHFRASSFSLILCFHSSLSIHNRQNFPPLTPSCRPFPVRNQAKPNRILQSNPPPPEIESADFNDSSEDYFPLRWNCRVCEPHVKKKKRPQKKKRPCINRRRPPVYGKCWMWTGYAVPAGSGLERCVVK